MKLADILREIAVIALTILLFPIIVILVVIEHSDWPYKGHGYDDGYRVE